MGPANWPEGTSGGATAVEYPALLVQSSMATSTAAGSQASPIVFTVSSSRHGLGYLTPQEFKAQNERVAERQRNVLRPDTGVSLMQASCRNA
jgi:hypothetical protein